MADPSSLPATPPERRCPAWVRVVLVLSLGLNLLIVGMVGGAVYSGGGPGAPRDAARDLGGTPFVRALKGDERRALLRDLTRERDHLRENRDVLRQRFETLLVTLRADTLDRAALERIFAEQRAAGQARQSLGERLVVNRIAEMSVEDRRAYADRLEADVRQPRR